MGSVNYIEYIVYSKNTILISFKYLEFMSVIWFTCVA